MVDLDRTLRAIDYQHWRVVLLAPRSKRPSGTTWTVTTNSDTVKEHLDAGGNVGLVCGPDSGVAVLDFDDLTAMGEMFGSIGPLPLTVETGSGKYHCYVKWEPGLKAKIEWKGKRVGDVQRGPVSINDAQLQHVVMPPSIHPNGNAYSWCEGAKIPGPLPQAWRELLTGASTKQRTGAVSHGLTVEQRIVMAKAWLITRPPAIQGQHGDNRTYITAACVAYDHDLAEDEAFDAMREWNAACIPPWSEADLRQKIRSALRSATGGRGEKLRFHESVPRPSWVPLGDEGWHWLREDRELAATDEELAQEEGIDPTAEEFHTLQELQELAPTPEDLDTELDDGDTLDEPPPEEDIID